MKLDCQGTCQVHNDQWISSDLIPPFLYNLVTDENIEQIFTGNWVPILCPMNIEHLADAQIFWLSVWGELICVVSYPTHQSSWQNISHPVYTGVAFSCPNRGECENPRPYIFSVLCNKLLPGDQSINLCCFKQPTLLFMFNLNTHPPQPPCQVFLLPFKQIWVAC